MAIKRAVRTELEDMDHREEISRQRVLDALGQYDQVATTEVHKVLDLFASDIAGDSTFANYASKVKVRFACLVFC